jgi:hypothetical protein
VSVFFVVAFDARLSHEDFGAYHRRSSGGVVRRKEKSRRRREEEEVEHRSREGDEEEDPRRDCKFVADYDELVSDYFARRAEEQ